MLDKPLVLIGMMGSGKTTVGRSVAKALSLPFVDNDSAVSQAAGLPVADLVRNDEANFRQLEAECIRKHLLDAKPFVFSLGGGAPMHPDTQRHLAEQALVVWLSATPEALLQRVQKRLAQRPMLDGDPAQRLAELLEARNPVYARLADHVIDVSRLPRFRVVNMIKELVQ